MSDQDVVASVLLAGLIVFFIGAVGWKLDYEKPPAEVLPIIHGDRRRWSWIHLWMIPALLLTTAGIVGLAATATSTRASTMAAMAAAVYAIGAVCWVLSLAFRLTVVPWAAQHTVRTHTPPESFIALDRWAASMYDIHMCSAYATFALLGAAVLAEGVLAAWVGWVGVGWGVAFLAGFVATRFTGPFNPPFWAHAYTGLVGVMILLA
jgi:hypothetical protein